MNINSKVNGILVNCDAEYDEWVIDVTINTETAFNKAGTKFTVGVESDLSDSILSFMTLFEYGFEITVENPTFIYTDAGRFNLKP